MFGSSTYHVKLGQQQTDLAIQSVVPVNMASTSRPQSDATEAAQYAPLHATRCV